jgi:cysteine desulfurase
MSKIYADCNATTPLLKNVKDYLINSRLNGPFANPNSLHYLGNQLSQGIENCRKHLGKLLSIDDQKIVFNSGSSESIATAFWMTIGQVILNKSKKTHLVCSTIEHAAVIENALYWKKKGATIHWINVSSDGVVDLEQLKQIFKLHSAEISLVAIMAANNETGVIQPYEQIAKLCKENHIPYLCDTTQTIGKLDLAEELKEGVFLCVSGHKLGAPLGSGFLVLPFRDHYESLIKGGPQEQNYRAGTQNYLGIESMTVALDWHYQMIQAWNPLMQKKIQFENKILASITQAQIIGARSSRLANTSLISFKGIHSQGLQIELEARNIFVTTSAACSDNEPSTSKVLRSMGIQDDEGRSVIRISTGLELNLEHYDVIAESIISSFNHLEKIHFN